jgi:hypothetical protein
MVIKEFKDNKVRQAVAYITCGLVAIFIIFVAEGLILMNFSARSIELFDIFIVSPRRTDYSAVLILLGILWYYQKSKYSRCLSLVCICLVSFITGGASLPFLSMIYGNQWAMVWAVPVIILYNGKYGLGLKKFFYIYYPLHCYVIAIANSLF